MSEDVSSPEAVRWEIKRVMRKRVSRRNFGGVIGGLVRLLFEDFFVFFCVGI